MLLREIVKIHGKKIKTMKTGISDINTNISGIENNIGNLSSLTTTEKSNIVGAVNENKSGIITINNKLQNGRALKNLLDASENYSAFTETNDGGVGMTAMGSSTYPKAYYSVRYNDFAVYVHAIYVLKGAVSAGLSTNVEINLYDVLTDVFGETLPVEIYNQALYKDIAGNGFTSNVAMQKTGGTIEYKNIKVNSGAYFCQVENNSASEIGNYPDNHYWVYKGILLRTDTLDI